MIVVHIQIDEIALCDAAADLDLARLTIEHEPEFAEAVDEIGEVEPVGESAIGIHLIEGLAIKLESFGIRNLR